MNLNLEGKNALVCGGSKGIGYAIAVELAKLGARIFLLSRTESILQDKIRQLNELNNLENDYISVDLIDTQSLTAKLEKLIEICPIHILINNTGGPKGGNILTAKSSDFLDAYKRHLVANHVLVKMLSRGMKEESYGRIINIISTSVRQPISGIGVSNTTRGAVASWSKTLSNELAEFGITVNNILPGATKTERLDEIISSKQILHGITEKEAYDTMLEEIPMRRFANPKEIASVAAFIASPAASYITGASIPVDGGKIKSI